MKRKLLSLLLIAIMAVVLILAFAACGIRNSDPNADERAENGKPMIFVNISVNPLDLVANLRQAGWITAPQSVSEQEREEYFNQEDSWRSVTFTLQAWRRIHTEDEFDDIWHDLSVYTWFEFVMILWFDTEAEAVVAYEYEGEEPFDMDFPPNNVYHNVTYAVTRSGRALSGWHRVFNGTP